MANNNFSEFESALNSVIKQLGDNKQYAIAPLLNKVQKISEEYPNDSTVTGMAHFLFKRADRGSLFITHKELKDVYSHLYTVNNKLAEYFPDELGIEKTATVKANRDPLEGVPISGSVDDAVLARQLQDLFSNKPIVSYSEAAEKNAKRACEYELACVGMLPKKIDVMSGTEKTLVCRASYDTPKGESFILIPVEIKSDKAAMPSVFLSDTGVLPITKEAIFNKLEQNINSNIVKTAEAQEIKDPVYEQPDEIKDFISTATSQAGFATMKFGKEVVEKGRNVISAMLKMAGYSSHQISISNSDESSIAYSVSIDGRKGFVVPIKIADNSFSAPKVLIANGSVYDFSANGISNVLQSPETDLSAIVSSSSLADLDTQNVMTAAKAAISNNKLAIVEDAMDVLKSRGEVRAFETIFGLYKKALSGESIKKTACAEHICGCPSPIKTSTSKYLICSHTGFPVHKVYQDKFGNCLPLYRKNAEEISDDNSAYLMYSKIFLG